MLQSFYKFVSDPATLCHNNDDDDDDNYKWPNVHLAEHSIAR